MHAVANNTKTTEDGIKRSDIVALDKLIAEGAPEEEKFAWGG